MAEWGTVAPIAAGTRAPKAGPRCRLCSTILLGAARRAAHSSSNTDGIKSSNPLEMSATFEEMSAEPRTHTNTYRPEHARTQAVAANAMKEEHWDIRHPFPVGKNKSHVLIF